MDGEIEAFLNRFELIGETNWNDFIFYEAIYKSKSIIIAKTGVGKVLAAMITQKIIDLFQPSAIICTGIAGTVNPALELGDILLGTDSVQHDFNAGYLKFKRGEIPYTPYRFFEGDRKLLEAALSFEISGNRIIEGRVLTGDQFVARSAKNDYSYLTEELHGDCVEMEGAAIALVATVNKIPHLIIRTISDKVENSKKLNIREFLKQASENSLQIIVHLIETL
jgi:5'-methylthioadenosine/S-adenosylhomocysteine nucleosidase